MRRKPSTLKKPYFPLSWMFSVTRLALLNGAMICLVFGGCSEKHPSQAELDKAKEAGHDFVIWYEGNNEQRRFNLQNNRIAGRIQYARLRKSDSIEVMTAVAAPTMNPTSGKIVAPVTAARSEKIEKERGELLCVWFPGDLAPAGQPYKLEGNATVQVVLIGRPAGTKGETDKQISNVLEIPIASK